jgi:hypothetical protein
MIISETCQKCLKGINKKHQEDLDFQEKEHIRTLAKQQDKQFAEGFKAGMKEAYLKFEKIIDKEIKNEEDAIKRNAKRNWTIVKELKSLKWLLEQQLQK